MIIRKIFVNALPKASKTFVYLKKYFSAEIKMIYLIDFQSQYN